MIDYSGKDWIEVTGVDLRKLIKAVYGNSKPQGLGLLHHREGPLSDVMVEHIMGTVKANGDGVILSLDYVNGRSCKFKLHRDEPDNLYIRKFWYDHSELDLRRVLRDSGLKEDLIL